MRVLGELSNAPGRIPGTAIRIAKEDAPMLIRTDGWRHRTLASRTAQPGVYAEECGQQKRQKQQGNQPFWILKRLKHARHRAVVFEEISAITTTNSLIGRTGEIVQNPR